MWKNNRETSGNNNEPASSLTGLNCLNKQFRSIHRFAFGFISIAAEEQEQTKVEPKLTEAQVNLFKIHMQMMFC